MLCVSLLNQSIVYDVQMDIRKVMDAVKCSKWFAYNFLLDQDGDAVGLYPPNLVKAHKDVQQTIG